MTKDTKGEVGWMEEFGSRWKNTESGIDNYGTFCEIRDFIRTLVAQHDAEKVKAIEGLREKIEKNLPIALHEYHRWALQRPDAGPEERKSQKRHLTMLFLSALYQTNGADYKHSE